MTGEDRVNAVIEFGFTRRQARFLVFVMRHAGVCLLRQYSTFAGIVHGQKTRAFFHKLVSRQYASAYACRHNRGRIYHVHHFELYRAIGEPNNSHRRPVPAGRVAERLMVLDAVLSQPELEWLTTTEEKVAHLVGAPRAVPLEALPRATPGTASASAANTFPERLPIGVAADGRALFLYVVMPSVRDDFRTFLRRHTMLLQALPAWTLRLAFPRAIAHAYAGYQTVVGDELETPRHPRNLEELKWYFEQLRVTRDPNSRLGEERFLRALSAFDGPRFSAHYRRWIREGDPALAQVSSTAISEALAAGNGRVESLVLPYRYDHLSPLGTRPRPPCDDRRVWRGETDETTPAPLHP